MKVKKYSMKNFRLRRSEGSLFVVEGSMSLLWGDDCTTTADATGGWETRDQEGNLLDFGEEGSPLCSEKSPLGQALLEWLGSGKISPTPRFW
jgi:hypothetical protein